MHLKDIGEFGFIKKVSHGCVVRPENVEKAIGDDSAVFRIDPENHVLVTTDLLIEGVHFLRESTSGFNLGYKSLAVNLSDIAAMGGIARQAFISLAVPDDCEVKYLEDVYSGLKTIAGKYEINILGGDTSRSLKDLVINIAVIGTARPGHILYRDRAKPGDIICVTGWIGDSRAGLHLLLNKIQPDKTGEKLIQAHLLPEPFLREGQFLSDCSGVHAAIDISDGLGSDLNHILEQSIVGADIYIDNLPLSDELKTFCAVYHFNSAGFAMDGGEDYVLVCTISPETFEKVSKSYLQRFGNPLYEIGQITAKPGIRLISGHQTEMYVPKGWDHFG